MASKQLTFIDLFAGIGGFHSGLENIGMKCIGWCERDKFAQKSYRAMYNTDGLWFSDDITMARGEEMPCADMWTFGSPCQDVSVAGNKDGIHGKASSMFFEVMRLLDERQQANQDKPQWLLMENVRNLLSVRGGWDYHKVCGEFSKRGYSLEWRVLNSKDYGVPQNRERVFIIGYSGNGSRRKILSIGRKSETALIPVDPTAGNSQGYRVYEVGGVSATLCSKGGGFAAKTGLYMETPRKINLVNGGGNRSPKRTDLQSCRNCRCDNGNGV